MKQQWHLLAAIVVAQLVAARQLQHRSVGQRQGILSAGPEDWDPCDYKEDSEGVIRPAHCEDEPKADGNGTTRVCKLLKGKHFSDFNCTRPDLRRCKAPDFGEHKANYLIDGLSDHKNGTRHGAAAEIKCAKDSAPIDPRYPNSTWGNPWYPGTKQFSATCSNGTWTKLKVSKKNISSYHDLFCVKQEQISLLKDMQHYLQWTQEKLALADAVAFKWIDSTAATRRNTLKAAHADAHRMLLDAAKMEVPEVEKLEAAIKAMKENTIVARGEPPSEATCKLLEKSFSSTKVPGRNDPMPGFTCAYTQQRTTTGYNAVLGPGSQRPTPTVYFRDGCMCRSHWKAGCPFQLQYTKSYLKWGFASMEQKIASVHPGAFGNALCWYWSDAAHPEWGFLSG